MRKTCFLLFVAIAMVTNAQTAESSNLATSCDTTACTMACKHQGNQRHKSGKHYKTPKGKRSRVPAFMRNLNEADSAMVKELMDSYRKDCKAVKEKYGIRENAKEKKPTEQQMDAMVKARTKCSTEILKLQEKYYDKLRKTLAPRQAAALLGMCGRSADWSAFSHGHKGNTNRQGHHACGSFIQCPCAKG
ncbi:MAG: hypothetical protein NC113_03975 [Bacteroides sp.]|nr:hypothetical protein [Bacteroides sp.]MCM1447369.1 hypothetical protein [Bacteroides sp.]MCM1515857.1 hypothetical protein [Paraprevotella sp.]